jgi:hypothetical protein
MKIRTRIIALGMALALAVAGAGCSNEDTSWVAQAGEDTLPAGVYLVELMMGYNDAASQLSGEEDILKGTIGDVPAPQYITDFAKLESAKLLAIRRQFQDRGLTLSDEDKDQATQYTDYLYSMGEDYYTANGVSKDSVQYINETSMMSLNVFNDIYGEGGEKGLTKDELKQAFAEEYTRSQYMLFPKVDTTTGAALDEDALAANKEKAESYLARALAGEHFPDLIYEQAVEQNGDSAGEQMEDDSYDVYLQNNAGFYPSAYESAVVDAADNDIFTVEDDYYIYLIRKLPILEAADEDIEMYLDAVLQEMKYDEYMETVEAWASEMDIRYNTAALAAYTPAKLKMTDEQIASSSSSSSESSSASSESETASSEASSGSSSAASQSESGASSESSSAASESEAASPESSSGSASSESAAS